MECWRNLGAAQVAVVCAVGDHAIQSELDRLSFPAADRISNPTPERGMFTSIQCASRWAGWNAELTHWAIVLGDQPHVRVETLRTVIEFSAAHPDQICMPWQGGHRRHPVLLPNRRFFELANSTAADLKQFLDEQATAIKFLKSEDPSLELDIDFPEDYNRALAFGIDDTREGK